MNKTTQLKAKIIFTVHVFFFFFYKDSVKANIKCEGLLLLLFTVVYLVIPESQLSLNREGEAESSSWSTSCLKKLPGWKLSALSAFTTGGVCRGRGGQQHPSLSNSNSHSNSHSNTALLLSLRGQQPPPPPPCSLHGFQRHVPVAGNNAVFSRLLLWWFKPTFQQQSLNLKFGSVLLEQITDAQRKSDLGLILRLQIMKYSPQILQIRNIFTFQHKHDPKQQNNSQEGSVQDGWKKRRKSVFMFLTTNVSDHIYTET